MAGRPAGVGAGRSRSAGGRSTGRGGGLVRVAARAFGPGAGAITAPGRRATPPHGDVAVSTGVRSGSTAGNTPVFP